MNKIMQITLAGIALVGLSACGGGGGDDGGSPVKSFNFADLNNIGYGVEFNDGDAYVSFGCGIYVVREPIEDSSLTEVTDIGNYLLVDNLVEMNSSSGDNRVLETSIENPGEIQVGHTYVVNDFNSSYKVTATWIKDDNQTCLYWQEIVF